MIGAGLGQDSMTNFSLADDRIQLLGGISFGDLLFENDRIIFTETNETLATLTGVDSTMLTTQQSA